MRGPYPYNPYSYNPYPNNFSSPMRNNPFNVPRMGAKETVFKKPLTLNSALSSAEKGIDTISSLIPIYQKVKPVIENGKDFVSLVKSKLVKKQEKKVEKVDVEIVEDNKKEEEKKEDLKKEKEETKPNNPFF